MLQAPPRVGTCAGARGEGAVDKTRSIDRRHSVAQLCHSGGVGPSLGQASLNQLTL